MIRPVRALAAALLAAVLLALVVSAATAASPTPSGSTPSGSSSAGQAIAGAALLRRADFGRGWREQAPAPAKVPSLTCPQFSPHVSGVTQAGAAASPTFEASSYGPFVSEIAHAYATTSEATALWRAVARPGLVVCAADSLRRGATQGVRFTVTGKGPLRLPGLPAPATAYRVTGTATLSYQTIDVYLDMLVVGRGKTIAGILLSSFEQPPPRRLEVRLAGTVARRMAG